MLFVRFLVIIIDTNMEDLKYRLPYTEGEYSFDEHIGAQLEILDTPFFNRRDDCDIILGVLEDKRKVTLVKCSLRISPPFQYYI